MTNRNKNISFYKKGTYIYIEGDEDTEYVFLVEKGEVEFSSSNQSIILHKVSAGKGDIFGFISALINRPRMETACARVDSTVIGIPKNRFITLLQKNSAIAFKLLNYYANALRVYDNMIFSLEHSSDGLGYDVRLFRLGEYYFHTGNYPNAYYILTRYLQVYPGSDYMDDAREMMGTIEKTGHRKIAEPIRKGIYYEFMDRQIIFCENEPGEELYIIKSGKVKIVKNVNNSEIMLSVLQNGEIFGELSIISNKPRNATAISFGTTVVMPINKSSLHNLFNRAPEILTRIFSSISKRVWFTYIRLEALTHKKPFTKIYAFLENKLIEENVSLKSKESYVLNFGVDELLKMTDLTAEKDGLINSLLADNNLILNMGQIIINDPSAVSAKARFYRSRDNLYTGDEQEKSSPPEPSSGQINYDQIINDMKKGKSPEPEPSVRENIREDISKSSLLRELDESMGL